MYIASSTAANLWLTPFLIGHLGIAAFGMIPLVTSVTAYMSVLTTALNTALSRFLVIDLERGDVRAANSTFNTTLFGLITIILALSPIVLGVSLAFPTLFNVPPGWEADASCLFVLVALTSFVTVVGSSFAVSPFIYSRFLESNVVSFVGLLTRVGPIALLFSLLPARLWYAGSGALMAALVSLLGFVLLWRKWTPGLHVQITAFDRSRLRALTGMGGWVTVNTLGGMLLARTDLLVVNAFFGAALTGGYGSVAQFSIFINYMASAAATVLRPIILIKYAQQDLIGLQRLASQSVKLLGLSLALPVGLLCGFARPLLAVWLGPDYQFLSVLLVILVGPLSLNLSVRPLLYVQSAYNKVRWPGIATLVSGVVSLVLAVVAGMWGGWGASGVALAVAVAWTAKQGLYVPIYTARIMKLAWWSFLPTPIPVVTVTLLVGIAAYALTLVRMPTNWLELAGSAAILSLLYAAGVWGIGLSRADRQLLRELLPWQTRQQPVSMEK
jgi:membrane protein EpsK